MQLDSDSSADVASDGDDSDDSSEDSMNMAVTDLYRRKHKTDSKFNDCQPQNLPKDPNILPETQKMDLIDFLCSLITFLVELFCHRN